MNERADELAEIGRTVDRPELCPGPQKYGSFWLRIKPIVRTQADECKKQLPRDSAPNKSILKQVARFNILRAMKLRRTIFVANVLQWTYTAKRLQLCPKLSSAARLQNTEYG